MKRSQSVAPKADHRHLSRCRFRVEDQEWTILLWELDLPLQRYHHMRTEVAHSYMAPSVCAHETAWPQLDHEYFVLPLIIWVVADLYKNLSFFDVQREVVVGVSKF